jgi:hypothetical protein
MNLQPVPIADIPLGKPLPWRLYDRNGYVVFARGDLVESREQLDKLFDAGLLRDMDAPLQTRESGDFGELQEMVATSGFPPPGIKPQVGGRLQIRLLNRSLQVFYSVRLIGYIQNRSILLTTPQVNGAPLILADGEQLEVRMVTGNNIYAFQAAIQRLCVTPLHYLHLDYPAEVRMQQLRKSPWARVGLSASVSNGQGAREVVRLVNLSSDGAQLHAPATLGGLGAKLQLTFDAVIDELKAELMLDATILHVQAAPQEAGPGMSEYRVAFSNVSATDALWLKGLVYRHIAEGGLA